MEIYTKVEKTRIVSPRVDKCMDYSIKEYQPTRGGSRARVNYDSYLDMDDLNDTRDSLAPTRGRTSTPSAAVRRAMQVLDETYRKQSYLKQDKWSRSAEQGSFRPIRTRRSPSPIKSRSPSPIRSSPVNWTPPRLVEIERDNYQDALDDSESRREILLRKLADAQKTMEMQNERLREGEMDSSECRATIRLLQQVQQELETKTRFLEKEREDFMTRSRQGAEERETLRRKLEEGSRDSNRLRCQLDLLLADKEQHHVTLEHLHKTINDLKSENKGTLELQATTSKDLDVTKERLNVCKQKCELLEKEKNHAFAEIEKQQKSQQALVNRNTDLGQRLSRCQHDLQDISERYDRNTNDLGSCKEELDICRDRLSKQGKDLNELRRSYSEMQQDRERALKYNSELEKTVHSIKEINQDLKRAKVACEDEMTELHGELAKIRLDFSRSCEENNIHMEDAKVLKKECAKLSAELSLLRPRAEELSERVKYLESTHNMDVQQMALLETQKNQTSRERDDFATRLSAQEESYSQLQNHHEEESKKLNQDLRDLRHEKEKLSTQLREAETQLSRISEELKTSTQHSQSQIDHWRQACSKLTSLVEEKDEDLRQGAIYRRELDEKLALAEAERRTTQLQMGELQASEEELIQLRADNKRLGQECAENQQMITVLEMQRDILAKSPSKSTSQDSVLKAQVEKLQAEVSLLTTKLNQVEAERNDLERRLKVNGPRGDQSDLTDDVGRLKGMNQLLAEQLTKVRQEAETLQDIIEEKNRNLDHVTRQLEREKQQLELRMASMNDEMRALKSNQTHKSMEGATELRNLRADVIRLKQDLEEKRQQVMVMEGEKVILENGRKRVEDRADALEAKLDDLRKEKMLDDARGKSPVHAGDVERLSAELKRTNAKLETAKAEIASLRKRLNDYDGVRTSQDDVIQALKQQLEAQSSSNGESDAASSGTSQPTSRDVKSLKRDLLRAKEEIAAKDKHLMELKRRFVETQKLEQKVRQERDELQGKTIIMESLNDSSRDVLQELDEVRQEKETLEKQLSIFLSSKTSQTPPTSLALGDDLDKELEKQYNTVCERNKWLETRIASLQREIELVRDQNSLLQEQRNSAEREASKLREEMKDLQMHTKGTRRKGEVEQIHLQHSNAEKLQQIMELERELNEKKQIIHAMAREMESLRKKSDKKKISNFMRKLKGSSTNSSRDLERSLPPYTASTSDGDPQWTTRSASLTQDTGYASHGGKKDKKRSSSLSPTSRPASFGDFPKVRRNSSQPPSSRKSSRSVPPVSPTLTYVTGVDDVTDGAYSPKRGSPGGGSPGARVSFDESSDPEIGSVDPGEVPSSRGGDSTRDVSHEDAEDGDNVVFLSEDYMPEDQIMSARHRPSSRRSSGTPRPSGEPRPTKAEKLPSPTSSPSLPSPTSGRSRSVPVYITAASDESSEDTGSSYSEEFEEIGGKRDPLFPSKLVKSPFTELSLPNSSKSGENSPPPRPQSQPTLKVGVLTPKQIGGVRKKHSSLV